MGRPRKRRGWKRLIFDDIGLVPVDHTRFGYYNKTDHWHLPGGEIATTKRLVQRAERRGVTLVLHTNNGERTRVESLI